MVRGVSGTRSKREQAVVQSYGEKPWASSSEGLGLAIRLRFSPGMAVACGKQEWLQRAMGPVTR